MNILTIQILTIQIIVFAVFFIVFIFAFVLIDDWNTKRKMKKSVKKWKDEVEKSEKESYRRKNK